MRLPNYISPSSLSKFEKDVDEFYIKYMAEPRPEREPQSEPASVGSAFDAVVKGNLHAALFGNNNFEELFESQVEKHNRDFAMKAGLHVYRNYVACGAYDELLGMMDKAQEAPQFEFEANIEINGIPLMGKPDARFVNKHGIHIILDWKVNGYCGKYNTSPTKGYKLCRDGLSWPRPSRSHEKSHKLYKDYIHHELKINEYYLEDFSIDWADQLSIYGWMMGETPGDEEVVVAIDQVVAKSNGDEPLLRIAQHRSRVSSGYQNKLVTRLSDMWDSVQSGHLFRDVTEEESREMCSRLDSVAAATNNDEVAGLLRGTYRAR
jgi:hypothetical protein